MKILIISYYYPPELTPRAFRTYELIKEFCEKGHEVVLILPQKPEYKEQTFCPPNLKIICVASSHEQMRFQDNVSIAVENTSKKRLNNKLFKRLKLIKAKIEKIKTRSEYYFFQANDRSFIKNVYKILKYENGNYNLLISICWPIETHIGTSIGLIFNKNLRKIKVKVAEYSDPFSTEQTYNIFWGYKIVDLIVGKLFDYIVVPTPKAISSYKLFKDLDHIKVIPQAFNLTEYSLLDYKPSKVKTFAYAGTFYTESRNPIKFAKYLTTINIPFMFIIYTLKESYDSKLIVHEIEELLNEKVELHFNIERKQLIKELSGIDFLLNFENATTNQIPSKVIDYAIAKRPICPISTINNQFEEFEEFLEGNYDKQVIINVEDYNIVRIAQQFINLA